MFPIRDHNPSSKFPIITLLIIALTSYIFFLEITSPNLDTFITQFSLIPSTVSISDPGSWLPFIYSIFLHGGWLHIISNMWFLWIFGDNVESYLGHIQYFIFYIITGLAAGFAQYLISPLSDIPTLGASGAVSGILGAYLVLYPKHKIDTLVASFGGFMDTIQVSSSVMLGYWFVIQLFSGIGSLGVTSQGGVAFFAHIGGFVAGVILIKLFPGKIDKADSDVL